MSDEVKKAQTAAPAAGDTIFTKILNGEIPTKFIYEDDEVSIYFLYFSYFIMPIFVFLRVIILYGHF